MTILTVYADNNPAKALATYTEFADIRDQLAAIGVDFERWQANQPLTQTATPDEVKAAYADEIARLNARFNYVTVDVVSMHPQHPDAQTARGKFLSEHTHADFETRFFVDGAGAFYIRKNGKVFMTVCTKGDLINLPANTTHWFDMGPQPNFKAIRFFRIADGWVGNFTGDKIAESFPPYDNAA